MKNKKQNPALKATATEEQNKKANVIEENENKQAEKSQLTDEDTPNKHDADSGNDGSTNQMLQQENLIDPGNEHNHLRHKQTTESDDNRSKKFDADAGGDGTGTVGSKPDNKE